MQTPDRRVAAETSRGTVSGAAPAGRSGVFSCLERHYARRA